MTITVKAKIRHSLRFDVCPQANEVAFDFVPLSAQSQNSALKTDQGCGCLSLLFGEFRSARFQGAIL